MKKRLFCILLSCCVLLTILPSKAKSEDWVSTLGEVISWGAGDGLMKRCAEYIGCDEYEDMSLSDQMTGLVTSNKKTFVCAANSMSKNSARIIGTAFLYAVIPLPASYALANLTGNALQCVQAIAQAEAVKQQKDKYELCYNNSSEGHPLPLTDRQIAKILPKMNLQPSIDNIVAQYTKLCVKKKGDEDSYRFYDEGDSFDGVYIHRVNGYAYLLCASLFDACPCVFNVQGGKINDPEYERDENDFIKIRSDGSLIHKGDDEKNRTHEKDYQDHYAKHCRLIRYKEIHEQSNDLASIYSDACFDMHGYSKRQANITAGIVQCFEDTARNIFEKPILSINQDLRPNHNAYDVYVNDYSFIFNKRIKIKNLLQGRTKDNFSSKDYPVFLSSDITSILQLLQEIWFSVDSTTIVSFVCTNQKRAIFSGYKTNIYNKYILVPSINSTTNCCSDDSDMFTTCFGDVYGSEMAEIRPLITEDQTEIEVVDMFDEIDKVDILLKHIQSLQIKDSEAEAVKVSKTGFTLTLFDLLRNKIKIIAIMALVFWVFIMGWKMINGDFGKINTKEFGMIALKVFLCYMVIFSDVVKDFVFNMAIQTSQGVGMFFNEAMDEFRTQKDNKYSQACNMKQNYKNTPKKIYGDIISADRLEERNYLCQEWEEKVCHNLDGKTNCSCDEYRMSCEDWISLNCNKYFKDYDGVDNKKYCKSGTCHTSDGDVKANIYKTGVSRKADEYSSYTFSCPVGSEDNGCSEYQTYFGKKQCVRRDCRKFELSCDEGQTLTCKRYEILPDGTYGKCVYGVCVQSRTTFVPLPPMERPYKVKSYFDVSASDPIISGGIMTYQPYCHKKPEDGGSISYESADPPAHQRFSSMLNDNIFVCDENYELDDGYRIKEYIRHGIIPDQDSSILVFQTLLPISAISKSDYEKVLLLKQMPIPTAVATTDRHGNISEYDFVEENSDLNGQQRAKYRVYIKSLFTYVNKNSAYPKIKEYGVTRNYSHLSFWDSLDCKIIQFISMQGFGGGFTDDINDVISGIQEGGDKQMFSSALNGMLQVLKFMFMSFPFGILVFILMFGISVALFMLVARAAQQYCICVFHLVMLIYLSPFVFLLWLFDQTKNIMKKWKGDVQTNILGACVPFVSISMFLYVIDWLFFGDASKYVSMQLFLPSGEISDNCYEGYINDAPIACLTKRCLKTFTWLGLLGLNSGGSFYSAETFKMLGYLVLRCLFAAGIIMSMTSLLDKLEDAIYNVIGGKPKNDIGVGFNGKASGAVKSGINNALKGGKFSLFSMKSAIGVATGTITGTLSTGASVVGLINDIRTKSKIGTTKKRLIENTRKAINYVPNKIKRGFNAVGDKIGGIGNSMSRGTSRLFGTKRWNDHRRRLNDIENNYNNSVLKQGEIRDQKIQNVMNAFEQQRNNNINIANEYANELAQQNRFNQQQIEYLKDQKLTELTNEANRIMQSGIDTINQEFDQKQNEILQIRNNSKNDENNNW